MDKADQAKKPNPEMEDLAMQIARGNANVAKWGLHIVVFLFGLLIAIVILVSQGVGVNILATLAILGLAAVWLMGELRGRQLFQRLYAEELSRHQREPIKEIAALGVRLTSRELQVLDYVSQGYANKQIASELGISENTVKIFVSGVLSKLNANDRTEAAVTAIKYGIIFAK